MNVISVHLIPGLVAQPREFVHVRIQPTRHLGQEHSRLLALLVFLSPSQFFASLHTFDCGQRTRNRHVLAAHGPWLVRGRGRRLDFSQICFLC